MADESSPGCADGCAEWGCMALTVTVPVLVWLLIEHTWHLFQGVYFAALSLFVLYALAIASWWMVRRRMRSTATAVTGPTGNDAKAGQRNGGKPVRYFWTVFAAFLAIGAVMLLIEHRNHLLGEYGDYLWVGLFLLCPLMHVFMHRHHGNNHQHGEHESDAKKGSHHDGR